MDGSSGQVQGQAGYAPGFQIRSNAAALTPYCHTAVPVGALQGLVPRCGVNMRLCGGRNTRRNITISSRREVRGWEENFASLRKGPCPQGTATRRGRTDRPWYTTSLNL